MAMKQVTLVLVGPFAGQTKVFQSGAPASPRRRQWRFEEGELRIAGDEKDVEGLCRYAAKCFQAYPKGSEEHVAAEDRYEKALEEKYGKRDLQARRQRNANAPAQDDRVQSDGQGPAEAAADVGTGAATDAAGTASGSADGNGHEDAGVPEGEAPEGGSPGLRAALSELDPANDAHWMSTGKPRVSVVEDIYGGEVTRAEIDAAYPGLTRTRAARQAAAT